MTPAGDPRSTGEMMADIMGNVGNIVRNEVDLARAEMSGSLAKASAALGRMVAAMILAVVGATLLSQLIVGLIVEAGLPVLWAILAVGTLLLLIGFALLLSAKSILNQIGFVPTRVARSVQRDAAAMKEAYNDK
jgi:hypothetical protein